MEHYNNSPEARVRTRLEKTIADLRQQLSASQGRAAGLGESLLDYGQHKRDCYITLNEDVSTCLEDCTCGFAVALCPVPKSLASPESATPWIKVTPKTDFVDIKYDLILFVTADGKTAIDPDEPLYPFYESGMDFVKFLPITLPESQKESS